MKEFSEFLICYKEILDLIIFQLYRDCVHLSLKRHFKHGHREQAEKCIPRMKEPKEPNRQGREN